jgi:small GTP-binding protein
MTRKAKVCLVGATAVGKSSLVARFVRSIFSDSYRTTIGVKIETRRVERPSGTLELVIWDLSGEDEFQNVQTNYLRGASGYLLVIDGTRAETKAVAVMLEERLLHAIGPIPFVVVLNKVDQVASWELRDRELDEMTKRGWKLVRASAVTGEGVNEAFDELSDAILRGQPWT